MKKAKAKRAKPRKKRSLRWLYATLLGVLTLLLAILFWSNYSQKNDVVKVSVVADPSETLAPLEPVNKPIREKHVYEDVTMITPQKEVLKIISPAQLKPDQAVLYDPLKQHGIALVIDDVGYNLQSLRRILALGLPVAIAIIPDSPYAKEAAKMAHRSGHIVMLHMPMEPANPHYRALMDDSFLRSDMSESTIKSMLRKGLEKVPYVEGINNHMGSFLTSMFKPMTWVMEFCKKNRLFFIDSKTIAKSVAADIAKSYGLVWGERRVFLDHSIKETDMKQAWALAEHYAKQRGGCIVIAHPHAETINFLEKNVTHLKPMLRSVADLLHVPAQEPALKRGKS